MIFLPSGSSSYDGSFGNGSVNLDSGKTDGGGGVDLDSRKTRNTNRSNSGSSESGVDLDSGEAESVGGDDTRSTKAETKTVGGDDTRGSDANGGGIYLDSRKTEGGGNAKWTSESNPGETETTGADETGGADKTGGANDTGRQCQGGVYLDGRETDSRSPADGHQSEKNSDGLWERDEFS